MRVEQTSATTFELQSDNGCMALAGFASETMGRPGVYFVRKDAGITREQAVEAFHAANGSRRSSQSRHRGGRQ